MYGELPECLNYEVCGNETGADDGLCRPCRLAKYGEIGKRQAAEYYNAQSEADELAEVMAERDERQLREAARDPRIPLGPDDDGEAFTPMSDEEMRAAQNWHATRWAVDPFETPAETIKRNWPNIFDGAPIIETMARC